MKLAQKGIIELDLDDVVKSNYTTFTSGSSDSKFSPQPLGASFKNKPQRPLKKSQAQFKIKPQRPLKKSPAQFKIKPRWPLDRHL
ncbi:hypothetical protein TB1_010299 [Malus domestica]